MTSWPVCRRLAPVLAALAVAAGCTTSPSNPASSPSPSSPSPSPAPAGEGTVTRYPVPAGGRPHDVAPAPDGGVWYTAQGSGELGARRVWSDSGGRVWVSEWDAGQVVVVEPASESFRSFPLPSCPSAVRQILGRPGEVWGAESAADSLVVVRGA